MASHPPEFERPRRRAELEQRVSHYVIPVYAVFALLALVFSGSSVAVSGAYFQTAAQVLPVLMLAFVLYEVALLERAPQAMSKMRTELDRIAASIGDDQKAELETARSGFDRLLPELGERLLDEPRTALQVVIVAAIGEGVALYAIGASEFSKTLAYYVAAVLLVTFLALVQTIQAQVSTLSSAAHVDVSYDLRDSNAE